MLTKLDGDLRREVDIDGVPHVITISPRGFLLTVKGRRKGLEIAWSELVSGDAALATALNASLTANVGAAAASKRAAGAVSGKKAAPAAPSAIRKRDAGSKKRPSTSPSPRSRNRAR